MTKPIFHDFNISGENSLEIYHTYKEHIIKNHNFIRYYRLLMQLKDAYDIIKIIYYPEKNFFKVWSEIEISDLYLISIESYDDSGFLDLYQYKLLNITNTKHLRTNGKLTIKLFEWCMELILYKQQFMSLTEFINFIYASYKIKYYNCMINRCENNNLIITGQIDDNDPNLHLGKLPSAIKL